MARAILDPARRLAAFVLLALALVFGAPAFGQDAEDYQQMTDAQQKSWLVEFVENRLSTPERQISISNLDGILGSDVSAREITISDQEGVWLRVLNARLNWNQAALFLGRLEVRSLAADSIEFIRHAVPAEDAPVDLPPPEAGAFQVPEFPVAIILEELSVPSVRFGDSVFGLGSEIALTGSMRLEGGSLDADLDIERLDGPGGTLDLDIAYQNASQEVDIDVTLNEPENGILANLLNLEGRPAVELTLSGQGPVSDLVTELALSADGRLVLQGAARLAQTAEGLAIDADLTGALAELIAQPYRPFFGDQTRLGLDAVVREDGAIALNALDLSGGQLSLEARGETTPDGFLRRLVVGGIVADPAGGRVTLPVAGESTRVDAARFSIDFGAEGSESWTAELALAGFETDGFGADTVSLSLGGVAAGLDDPAERRVTVNGDGVVSGISASEEIEAALGDSIGLGIAGLWNAGEPIRIAELRIAGQALEAVLSGTLDEMVFDGEIALQTASIAPFSGLAERDLSGALRLAATGTVSPLTGGFDLTLDGVGQGLSIADEIADRLLAGDVMLSGRVARTEEGLIADDFRLGNARIALAADGIYATGAADFAFTLSLADMALLAEGAQGALSVTGTARGADGRIALDLDAAVPAGTLAGRPLREAGIGFAGTLVEGELTGAVTGTGFLDGHRVSLASGIAANQEGTRLSDIRFETAGARVTGDLTQRPDGLVSGTLAIAATDVSTAAALALLEARGALDADLELYAVDDVQGAEFAASVSGLVVNDIRISSAEIAGTARDLFGVPAVDGRIVGSGIVAAGAEITRLDATASQSGDATQFSADASLAAGTTISVAGSLAPEGTGYRLGLDRLSLVQGQLGASLAAPTELVVDTNRVELDAVRFNVGSGSITATGSAGQTLDVGVAINALPLNIANAVVPGLGLAGTLNGEARITGSAGDPRVAFTAEGTGLNAAAIADLGIAPLSASARGSFAANTVTLDALSATGTGGLQLAGSGRVPLEGSGLSLSLTGSAPLSLANRFVADRGGQATGVANLDAQVTGSLASPQFSGRITTAGAGYIDPETNLRLTDITAAVALTGTEARIETLSASLATGGSVSGSGTVGLTGQFPANLAFALDSARYADGNLFVATVSGNLSVTGNLLGNPLLGGTVLIERAEISVPEAFAGGPALIDVRHVNTPPRVQATLDRASIDARGAPVPASRSPGLLLDLTVNAPNQIFIRGRGLDAEAGGSVRLTGPLNNIQPVGAFELIRGRLSILGQRLDFESGSVTLAGDLDPFLSLVARTEGDGITVFVTLSGRVSDLEVNFSSNPTLPQDEILARLIFNRSMGELSPLQIARLAAAAAELVGGGGGGGPLDSLREAAGLADLDVVTDAEGNVAVQAGAYIQDNVYLGVTAGADGQSRVTINLDATENLRITGAAGADGSSSLGVFYEMDY